jgi:hypothetical protein
MMNVEDSELPERFAPGAAGVPITVRKLAGISRDAYAGECAAEAFGYTTQVSDM